MDYSIFSKGMPKLRLMIDGKVQVLSLLLQRYEFDLTIGDSLEALLPMCFKPCIEFLFLYLLINVTS